MDYEKKYKEAIERAKHYQKENGSAVISAIFPELKESEDEKIRKQIISFLKEFEYDHYRNLNFSSWISWLEKQGLPHEKDFGAFINNLSEQFPEVSFAKLSRIAVRVKNYLEKGEEQESQGKSALETINEGKVDDANKVEPTK